MDFRIFHEFVELVLQGSYSSAARTLNVSQPTLSRHVSTMEKELGTKLIADVVPVRLTPAGSAVFQAALQMDDLYSGLRDDLAALRRVQPTRVRIHDTLSLKPLSSRIVSASSRMAHANPSIKFEYTSPPPGLMPAEAIAQRACDLSFVQLFGAHEHPLLPAGVQARQLGAFAGRALVGVPKGLPLAGRPAVQLDDLKHEPVLMLALKSNAPFKATFVDACLAHGFRPSIKMIPCRLFEEFYLVDHGEGLYVLSERDLAANASLRESLSERLALIPLAAEGAVITWHALYRTPDRALAAQFAAAMGEE